jgi:hypothetical protein
MQNGECSSIKRTSAPPQDRRSRVLKRGMPSALETWVAHGPSVRALPRPPAVVAVCLYVPTTRRPMALPWSARLVRGFDRGSLTRHSKVPGQIGTTQRGASSISGKPRSHSRQLGRDKATSSWGTWVTPCWTPRSALSCVRGYAARAAARMVPSRVPVDQRHGSTDPRFHLGRRREQSLLQSR